jgi:hypothetical protein
MSFWWYTRDKRGKRHLWGIDTDPMAVMLVLGLTVASTSLALLQHPSIPFILIISGLACLILAKLSLYRQGIRLSFGSALMSRRYASLYKVAYVLMGIGVLLMVLLLSAPRLKG